MDTDATVLPGDPRLVPTITDALEKYMCGVAADISRLIALYVPELFIFISRHGTDTKILQAQRVDVKTVPELVVEFCNSSFADCSTEYHECEAYIKERANGTFRMPTSNPGCKYYALQSLCTIKEKKYTYTARTGDTLHWEAHKKCAINSISLTPFISAATREPRALLNQEERDGDDKECGDQAGMREWALAVPVSAPVSLLGEKTKVISKTVAANGRPFRVYAEDGITPRLCLPHVDDCSVASIAVFDLPRESKIDVSATMTPLHVEWHSQTAPLHALTNHLVSAQGVYTAGKYFIYHAQTDLVPRDPLIADIVFVLYDTCLRISTQVSLPNYFKLCNFARIRCPGDPTGCKHNTICPS